VTITLAVANQKGGVAKTTSVASLGAAFAELGLDVLLVDLDPQACLTFSLGVDPDDVELSVNDVLCKGASAAGAVLEISADVHLLPATLDLAGAEAALHPVPRREYALATALGPLSSEYDIVVLDCSPSLGLLTINALAAADDVLIPLQCEMLSHRGVGQLLDTISDVQRLVNPRLAVAGVLPTMFDPRTTHARAVLADVGQRYELTVLQSIPRSVRFAEAPALGLSVLQTARSSKGAEAYRAVAAELVRTWGLETGGR
jgi:chromosome partitioning protein